MSRAEGLHKMVRMWDGQKVIIHTTFHEFELFCGEISNLGVFEDFIFAMIKNLDWKIKFRLSKISERKGTSLTCSSGLQAAVLVLCTLEILVVMGPFSVVLSCLMIISWKQHTVLNNDCRQVFIFWDCPAAPVHELITMFCLLKALMTSDGILEWEFGADAVRFIFLVWWWELGGEMGGGI